MQQVPSEGFSLGRLLDTALSTIRSEPKSVVDSTSGVLRLRRLLPLLAALAVPASALAQTPEVPQGSAKGAAELRLAQDQVSELQGTLEREWDTAMFSAAFSYAPEVMDFVRQMELEAGDIPSEPNGDPVWTQFLSPMLEKMGREGGHDQQANALRQAFVQESLKSLFSIYQKELAQLHSAIVAYVADNSQTDKWLMDKAFRSVQHLEAQVGEFQNFEQSFDSLTGGSTEKESSQTRYQMEVQDGLASLPQSWMAQFEYLNATFDRYQGLLNQKDLSSTDRDDLEKACFLIIGARANLGEPNFSAEAQNVKLRPGSSLKDTSMDGRDGPAPILQGDTLPSQPISEVHPIQQQPEQPIDLKYFEAFERQFTAIFLAQFNVEWQAYVSAAEKAKTLPKPFDYRVAFEKALRVAQENMSNFHDQDGVLGLEDWDYAKLRYYFGTDEHVAYGALKYALTHQTFSVEAPDVLDGTFHFRAKRVMRRDRGGIDDWMQGGLASSGWDPMGCEAGQPWIPHDISGSYRQLCNAMDGLFDLQAIEPSPATGNGKTEIWRNTAGELRYGPLREYAEKMMGPIFDAGVPTWQLNSQEKDPYHGEEGRAVFLEQIARLVVAQEMRR